MTEIVASYFRLLVYTAVNRIARRLDGNTDKYTGKTEAAPGKCGTSRFMGLFSLA
jgi:hypothetical protein